MRFSTLRSLSACGLLLTGFALSYGSAPAQTVKADDIICRMSDSCDDTSVAPAGSKQTNGDEKMFSLQKAQNNPAPAAVPGKPAPPKVTSSAPSYKPGAKAQVHAGTGGGSVSGTPSASHEMAMQVHFLLGSAVLTPDARTELGEYVKALQSQQLAGMKFVIEGHTDSTGSYATNLDLSKRRAQSVVDFLVANGVSPDRLQAMGYGPDRPLTGATRTSPLNRRVELVRAN